MRFEMMMVHLPGGLALVKEMKKEATAVGNLEDALEASKDQSEGWKDKEFGYDKILGIK